MANAGFRKRKSEGANWKAGLLTWMERTGEKAMAPGPDAGVIFFL